jgi:HupE / UreJ protein
MIGRSRRPLCKVATLILLVAMGGVVVATPAISHDVPDQISMSAFIKPGGERLHFLVRVPLTMLLNIGLPKRGPGYLDLALVDEGLDRAAAATARELVLYENGSPLAFDVAAARISQPSEDAFGSYWEAVAHIAGPPLPDTANVFWNQGYFDLHLEYPITSQDSRFALDMLAGAALSNRTKLLVQFLSPAGAPQVYEVHGGHGWLELDPSWYHAGWTFMQLGFQYVLHNIEQLLFLFCLVLPFRTQQLWALLGIITSFTVAHAVTVSAAVSGLVPVGTWFPPLIQALIVLSILYLAVENILIVWLGGDSPANLRWRWVVAGVFGLIHGFGFSFVVQHDLQLAGVHRALSLLAFSVGVGLAQLAVLLVALPVLAVALRRPKARRAGIVILSALVGHTAWNWTLEQISALRFVRWPTLDAATLGWLLAGLTLVAVLGIALRPAQRPAADPLDAAGDALAGHRRAGVRRHGRDR